MSRSNSLKKVWYENKVAFVGDKKAIGTLLVLAEKEGFLDSIIPVTSWHTDKESYTERCTNKWGCRWEVVIDKIALEGDKLYLEFESLLGAPLRVYEFLERKGIVVAAVYTNKKTGELKHYPTKQ